MSSTRRPPLAGRIAAAMCLIVCLTITALRLFLVYLGSDAVKMPLEMIAGLGLTCAWLAIAPPASPALSFLPALGGLAYTIFTIFDRANITANQMVAVAMRQAASGYTSGLALLLVGLAVLTRRSRMGAAQPEGIMVYSVLDRSANIRELRVASAAFLSAGILYLATGILMPFGGMSIAARLAIGLLLCASGAATQEFFGYLLLRPETFRNLLEESQPIASALRMAGWLIGSFVASITLASVLVIVIVPAGHPIAVYTWIGAGGWLGVASWIYRDFLRMEGRETAAHLLRKVRTA